MVFNEMINMLIKIKESCYSNYQHDIVEQCDDALKTIAIVLNKQVKRELQ